MDDNAKTELIDDRAELISENEELKKQIRDLKQYYYQFHHDVLNFMLKKDLISSFMKYRKKRKRDAGLLMED